MQVIKGKVENVENLQIGVHEKAIVDVKGIGRERAFVEFRGKAMMDQLAAVKIGERVEIVASLEANVSKAGVRFNNLIAFSINKSDAVQA